MAKVTMPLMSGTASGQLAKSVVHFGWKGIAVVRKYLKPANPKSANQGDVRLVLGGLGAASRAIGVTSPYADDARMVAPAGQTFVSALVGYVIKQIIPDATAFEALYDEFDAHGAKSTFVSTAATLGLADFDVTYKGTEHSFVKGLQLYCLAKYGIARRDVGNDIFNRSPYDTAIGSWTGTEIGELATDVTDV